MKIIRLWMIWLVMMGLPPTFSALACSGGPSFNDFLTEGRAIVHAEVIQVDADGQNAVLRVHEVLFGDVPETVLLLRNEPGQVIGVREGFLGGGDCNSIDATIRLGQKFYTNLSPDISGAYNGGYFIFDFETPETEHSIYPDYEEMTVDEAEFRAVIAELGGQTPHAPTPSGFPRFAPLEITTQDGERYLIPLGGGAPVHLADERMRLRAEFGFWMNSYMRFESPCTPQTCVMSADGGMVAQLRDDGLLVLPKGAGMVSAQAFALSPVSGWLATLNEGKTVIYSTGYRRTGGNPFDGIFPMLNIARDISRQPSNTLVWSPDGKKLAYADSDGVMVLDVTEAASITACCNIPDVRQIVSAGADELLVTPTGFSPGGTFLRVEQGDEARWVRLTDPTKTYPDGVWSPDDLSLMTDSEGTLQWCTFDYFFTCRGVEIRLVMGDEFTSLATLRGVAWHNRFEATLWACLRNGQCGVFRYHIHGDWPPTHTPKHVNHVRLMAHQPHHNYLALVTDEALWMDWQPVDLGGVIDVADIAEIRWLRSVWP